MFSEHYRLPPKTLTMLKVESKQQLSAMELFIPAGLGSKDREQHIEKPFGKVSLMHYMDNCGLRFMDKPKTEADKIAKAMFEEMNSEDKLAIYMYVEFIESELEA